jgi:hypothetical protein
MINPWTQGRVPGVPMNPTLGAWLVKRKMASPAWSIPQWVRLSLQGAHLYWYQFPELTLTSGQTDLTRVTVSEDFWVTAIMGRGSRDSINGQGSFRFQITEDLGAYKYSKYGQNQGNFAPTALEPGLIRFPHFIPAGSPVVCKIQNLDGSHTNIVDLCMFGYSTWWRQ